jgi:gliding motility-associated-like protein
MQKLGFIFFLASALVSYQGAAQNLSNTGKEFWVGYGHHQFMETGANNQDMVLYFSAEQTANVTVVVRGRTATQTTNYVVPAGTVISSTPMPKAGPNDCRLYDVPPTFGGNGGEGLFNVSIQITSDVPIVAYAHIYGNASSGATMLMPVETWGYSYISINSKQVYQPNCFSWFYVIAQHDNTMVEITPSQVSRLNRPANVPFTVTLNKGQIYQVMGGPEAGSTKSEMSGSKIRSIANSNGECYPIAAFSGSSRTSNAISCGSGGGDNDNQQLFPTQAWGKRYLTAPTSRSTNASQVQMNSYKVLVKDPTTIVKRNGVVLTGLTNSHYFFESNTADYIEADKPIMVAQFMTGGNCMGGIPNVGDPEMIYISPLEQGIKRVGFYRNDEEGITVNYLTLIIPNNGVSTLLIDGSPAFDHSYPHPQLAGYTVIVKKWTAAKSQAIVSSDSAFTAITYGLGSVESYGYNAGTLINNLNALSHIHNTPDPTLPQHPYTCVETPIELSALVAYQPTQLDFLISQLGANVTPNADVSMLAPVPSGTVLVNGVPYYKYTLPGTYTFHVADTFTIPLVAYHPAIENCYLRDSLNIQVIVKGRPVPDFTVAHTGCTLDAVNLTGTTPTSNNYNVQTFNWTFPVAPFTATGQNQNLLMPPGTHAINLEIISEDGCISDTTKEVTVFDKPPAEFEATPVSLCVGNMITFTDTSSATVTVTEWYWDFGNGVTQTTAGPSVTYTYPLPGTYTVRHATRSSVTCVSDTIDRVVTIFAKPVTSFTFTGGCLDVTGTVQFNGSATVSDGQTINSWAWDFGDPNATGGNPNTSIIQNPTHNYQPGTYTISLTATTANGCAKDTLITTTFNLKPALDYPALTGLCENAAAVSVDFGSVTNGVTGTEEYHGPATTLAGMFDPAVAGPGIHTIWYVFNSSAGCIDSISQTIEVFPQPAASFDVDLADLCAGETLTITPNSNIPTGTITNWNWDLGDGTTPSYTNGNPFTVNYANFNSYTIQLVNISDRGCISEPFTRTIGVHAIPVADFDLPAGVCMPNGSAQFTNQSQVADNANLSYQWDFGDGSGTSTTTSPSYVYGASGSYNVTLVATSEFGCTHQVTQAMNNFFEKPVALFDISSLDICQGEGTTLTDNSSDPAATITVWNWSFGDGSNSIQQNPVKTFSSPGTYDVTLTVTNDIGCVSDPFVRTLTVHVQPVIDAGQSFVLQQGTTVQLTATANDPTLTFNWSPPFGLDDATILNPTLTALADQTYTLTAIGSNDCEATDFITVKILKPVTVPNVFSPNGDGIHDRWVITNLQDYPGSKVGIFNRYGQEVYRMAGSDDPWDGTYRGKPLPVGTYYFVITLENGFKPITGSVTILR